MDLDPLAFEDAEVSFEVPLAHVIVCLGVVGRPVEEDAGARIILHHVSHHQGTEMRRTCSKFVVREAERQNVTHELACYCKADT